MNTSTSINVASVCTLTPNQVQLKKAIMTCTSANVLEIIKELGKAYSVYVQQDLTFASFYQAKDLRLMCSADKINLCSKVGFFYADPDFNLMLLAVARVQHYLHSKSVKCTNLNST